MSALLSTVSRRLVPAISMNSIGGSRQLVLNSSMARRALSSASSKSVTVYFIDRDGDKRVAKAKMDTTLLDAALDNNIDLEGFG